MGALTFDDPLEGRTQQLVEHAQSPVTVEFSGEWNECLVLTMDGAPVILDCLEAQRLRLLLNRWWDSSREEGPEVAS